MEALILLAFVIVGALTGLKRTRDSERIFIFRLGHPKRLAGPGLIWLVPMIDRGFRVDLDVAAPGWRVLSESKVMELVLAHISNGKGSHV